MSDQARLAEIKRHMREGTLQYGTSLSADDCSIVLAALREAERRAEEAESKLATATETIRSLTALASERETT